MQEDTNQQQPQEPPKEGGDEDLQLNHQHTSDEQPKEMPQETEEKPAEPAKAEEPAPTPTPTPETAPEPASATEASKPAEEPSHPSTEVLEGGPRKKILLVEDDVALAAVYRSRLELEDFDLREVNDGEHALTAAKEFRPDLILLDAMMPKISGFDVLDILRHTPETANIRVIMLTALSQPKDKERAENLGVDDYLVKSQVVIGDVVERVKHHLGMD